MLAWDNPPGGSYTLNAIAMDNAGLNTTSAVVNITVTCSAQPAPPANVSATDGAYCGAVLVSWSPSSGATGYDVYRDGHFVANAGASPYNDVPGDSASHSYTVTATNNCGQSAAGPADTGYATQVPPPPAGVSATDGTYCGLVQVSWNPSTGATGYDVYRDGHLVANVGASPYNDAPGDSASHSYTVTATYNCGQSAAGPADTGYATQVPSPPTGVSASDGIYCGVVKVSWTPSSGAASYNVYRDGALVGNVAASPFSDTPGDTSNHLYTVAAGNGLCTSAPSAPNVGYAQYCPGDFSMSVSPVSQTVKGSTAARYSVTVTASGGFSGTVTFSVTGLPNGATQTFSPTAVTGSGSSVLTITAPLGTYNLTITGTSGSLVHQVAATLVVSNGDFSVTVSPSSRTITAGKSTTYTAKCTPTLGFNGSVTWSVTGLPTGVSGNFTPSGTATVLLAVSSAKTTRSGTYTLTLVGTSGALHHSTTVSLIVR